MNWQQSWAYHKYWVMAHSQQMYNEIRALTKDNQWSQEKQFIYEQLLLQTQQINPTKGSLCNTYQHIWGYFKKVATVQEKKIFQKLLMSDVFEPKKIECFLKQMLYKYPNSYLMNSKVFIQGFN